MAKKLALFVLFLVAFGIAVVGQAAELYVNPDGNVKISDAEITSLNNNVIIVNLWGSKWVLFVDVSDSGVKLSNASGETITVWDLVKGHKIYVEGRVKDVGAGRIEILVSNLRDMSLGGKGVFLAAPSVIPPPPPPKVIVKEVVREVPVQSAVVTQSTQSSPVSPYKHLVRGMEGDDVIKLQEVLFAEGYLRDDEVTGFFGEATERALKKLQKANGLAQEGSVGPLTHGIIEALGMNRGDKKKDIAAILLPKGAVSPQALSSIPAESQFKRLSRGMEGQAVRDLQEVLLAEGYLKNDEVTGFFGPATEAAVKKLQKANGLAQEGSVGPLTHAAIETMRTKMKGGRVLSEKPTIQEAVGANAKMRLTKNLRPGMSGEEVIILQEFLQANNWGIPDDGPVTGYYGGITQEAVANFQEASGLEAIGAVGPATRELINKLLGR